MVVAVKLDVIESRSDAVPGGHGSRFGPADMGHGGGDDIAESQRPADQDDFKLDRGAEGEVLGAEKINARGTDVARNERNRKFFGDSTNAAKPKGEV